MIVYSFLWLGNLNSQNLSGSHFFGGGGVWRYSYIFKNQTCHSAVRILKTYAISTLSKLFTQHSLKAETSTYQLYNTFIVPYSAILVFIYSYETIPITFISFFQVFEHIILKSRLIVDTITL